MCIHLQLTVIFEDPFWIGVFEKVVFDKLEVAKVVFGAEPKDYEVYSFIQKNFFNLRFSSPVDVGKPLLKKTNPKRVQREISSQLSQKEIGTKAQQALKTQQEEGKKEKLTKSKQLNQAKKLKAFELKQLKKKEKHRGR